LTEADRALGQKVMHELSTDATLSAQLPTVRMTIDGGKVTLHGTAKSEEQKLAIETAVEKIAGVTSVDNQLQVSATGTSSSPSSSTTATPGSTSDSTAGAAPQK
jgi:osmotically-inducible protein OsmY